MRTRHRLLIFSSALLVLLAVFSLYLRPSFLITLADQLWSCF
jgi:hypothetical protein